MTTAPFAEITTTEYGAMIVHTLDEAQAGPLLRTGRAVGHSEIMLLRNVLNARGGDAGARVMVDAGANFGTFSLGLWPHLGESGMLWAFEPQPVLHAMLAGTMVLNGALNVRCYCEALGAEEGRLAVPLFDYTQPLSFGSIEFGDTVQHEVLAQLRQRGCVETVPVRALDSYGLDRLDLFKIDVEGMELAVLDGAAETIRHCRPILYVEWLKVGEAVLRERLKAMDYVVTDCPGCNFLALPF